MRQGKSYFVMLVASAIVPALQPLSAQSRHERKEQQLADSAAPKNVAGGVTFQSPTSMEKTFEVIANDLKRQGHAIDRADKDAGQIVTAMEITGGYTQTGTRILVTLIKDSDTQTSVRVVVAKQKRKKLLQTEPWGDPKSDDKESQTVAEALKAALS
jgi:hypothetical protein